MHTATEVSSWQQFPKEFAGKAEEQIKRLDGRFRAMCRERPLAMLAGSLVLGFIVARLVSRR